MIYGIFRYAPRHEFLILLLNGWRFANDIAEPMIGRHGDYSVLMERVDG